ncbi:uncharacterized protein LOC110837333 [Zootermopsis nevadensis]|uniref:Uncharacterized protein n=1 Tax=Zootermopsis nevadensis TaxID=136037 RepID=A0A067QY71_ZOONE|nr:uncharacterized protein LOC110837333 [Zootermopsis nevadensis]KDR11158.1 hypothetical protein L798_14940 [Zootermopsis nevadensis]
MSTNRKDQLLAALIVTCLVAFLAEIMADETTTEVSSNTSWVSENNTQNAYVISSVQFEIGIMENETEGSGGSFTTSAPVETDKLTETKVAFLLPPAALFNSTQPTSAP